jgi:DNA processing protein
MEDPRYAIALRDALGPARDRSLDLLRRFGAPRFVFGQPLESLREVCGERLARRLTRPPDLRAAEAELASARAHGLDVLLPGHEGFPPMLLTLEAPPLALYVRGRLPAGLLREDGVALAIVGSRRPSVRARDSARSFAAEVAAAGVVVVSGLAYGIDAAAHEGALDGGGVTVAVLASGADRPSPAGNVRLAERIVAAGGALLSESPPGTPAFAARFAERNRLISGLARTTLVVEARERSGSLITAHHALAQGRELLVVPGPIDSAGCRGSNGLLRAGKAVTSAEELLRDVAGEQGGRGGGPPGRPPEGDARRVLAVLEEGPCAADALGERLGLGAAALSALLVELELAGHVARTGSRVARRAGPQAG